MDPVAWDAGFPPFEPQPFVRAPNSDDWEDWLRWDPAAADHDSPEDGTLGSGSSKNDSPIQEALLPVPDSLFGKDETLAQPMIVGEDGLDFGGDATFAGADDTLLFGSPSHGPISTSFDFQPALLMQPASNDTHSAAWPLPSNAGPEDIDLASVLGETYGSVSSAAPGSSNPPSLHYSPEASTTQRTSVSSGESPAPAKKRGGRKRKAETREETAEANGDSNEDGEDGSGGDGDGPPMKKTSHNVIEKRYRNNLNDKIVELRNSVPSLRAHGSHDAEDLGGLKAAHKLNKATVMAKATEYIKHLEQRNKTMADEMSTLKARLAAVEAAIGKSADHPSVVVASSPPPSGSRTPRHNSTASQNGVQGFLNVSPNSARFPVQQQYSQSQSYPAYQRPPNAPVEAQNGKARGRGGAMNKVMLGAMAGLMTMEGLSEQQQQPSNGDNFSSRGLMGLPLNLFKRGAANPSPTSASQFATQAAIPLLKMSLVVGVLLYLLAPLLTFSPRRKQKSRPTAVRLPPVPSLASPIEVRRQAWLTAIQTVWVPKHFLLEVVAVTTKMVSLSVRRLVGAQAYSTLTGSSKEDEVARVKAWDIAIDAQLAGGDAAVSYYRLLLTLMESGTLPDSPTRLMQKAVHFRVFFWEVANAGYGNMMGFKQFTEKVGNIYWDSARRQQRELVQAASQSCGAAKEDEVEMLPDHLASLLDLDCDDVLTDEMIQRAWNLAWNKPSAYKTVANQSRDAVVEDHAIRSPLDAVAAWFANTTLDATLRDSLGGRASQIDTEYYVALAVSVAPPASATQARALTAKAVLSNCNRETNVLAALDALPSTTTAATATAPGPPPGAAMNVVSHLPAAPDVLLALTLAKLLALANPAAPPAAHARALASLAALQRLPPAAFTLLPAVAAFRLLKLLLVDRLPAAPGASSGWAQHRGIEDLAANLRVWIGVSASAAGLKREDRARVVELCLAVAKRVGGWDRDRDSGYGSVETSPVPEGRRGVEEVAW